MVFFKDGVSRDEVMAYLRKRYKKRLYGVRMFDRRNSVIYLREGFRFPPRKTRQDALDEIKEAASLREFRRILRALR